MLSTLIYRSLALKPPSQGDLDKLVALARERNSALHVTGILLYDGSHFFQLLEGPSAGIDELLASIGKDPRHTQVVKLLRDYSPGRRFGRQGMDLLDMRGQTADALFDALLARMTARGSVTYEDRVVRILRACTGGSWKDHFIESFDPREWTVKVTQPTGSTASTSLTPGQPCQFALQPIVEPLTRKISSFEALIRGPAAEPPDVYFASLPAGSLYEADLYSKRHAFELARRLDVGKCKLSINLLPMSLVEIPNAVDILRGLIVESGLVPEQVIVEVTEQEVISRLDEFHDAVVAVRQAGIGLAIDDFGAGFAGLGLLADFQPDKLKIDRCIVQSVHRDGPRQAIVRAIVEFCASLGISPVAEGVETLDEWCWLQAAGVERFQGFLFARPMLNGIPPVAWPERLMLPHEG